MQFRGEQRGAVVTYFFRTIMHWSVGFPAADSHELKNILNVIFFGLKKKTFDILSGYMSQQSTLFWFSETDTLKDNVQKETLYCIWLFATLFLHERKIFKLWQIFAVIFFP